MKQFSQPKHFSAFDGIERILTKQSLRGMASLKPLLPYVVFYISFASPTVMSTEALVFELPPNPKENRKIHTDQVSLLPCKIEYDGSAPVHLYFRPELVDDNGIPISIRNVIDSSSVNAQRDINQITTPSLNTPLGSSENPQYYSAAIRGRQITGRKVYLPEDTVGIVLSDGKTPPASMGSTKPVSKLGKKLTTVAPPQVIFEEGSSVVQLDAQFSSFFLWNRDQNRHDNNYIARSIEEYLPIQAALHGVDSCDSDDE